jgi:hypothetical protein
VDAEFTAIPREIRVVARDGTVLRTFSPYTAEVAARDRAVDGS